MHQLSVINKAMTYNSKYEEANTQVKVHHYSSLTNRKISSVTHRYNIPHFVAFCSQNSFLKIIQKQLSRVQVQYFQSELSGLHERLFLFTCRGIVWKLFLLLWCLVFKNGKKPEFVKPVVLKCQREEYLFIASIVSF